MNQHIFISFFSFECVVDSLHHYKKYLAIVGAGAAITAVGLGMFLKAKREEKH